MSRERWGKEMRPVGSGPKIQWHICVTKIQKWVLPYRRPSISSGDQRIRSNDFFVIWIPVKFGQDSQWDLFNLQDHAQTHNYIEWSCWPPLSAVDISLPMIPLKTVSQSVLLQHFLVIRFRLQTLETGNKWIWVLAYCCPVSLMKNLLLPLWN